MQRRVQRVAVLALVAASGCSEPVSERFSVQREGERYFVRERRGWFSALLPCKPAFSRVSVGTDKVRMEHAACKVGDEAFSITFGRFKLPEGMAPTVDQIYELAAKGMNSWANRSQLGNAKIEDATIADRPARHLTYTGVDGGTLTAHSWILWAEEQTAIYQISLVGNDGPAEGERLVRSMLVPSP